MIATIFLFASACIFELPLPTPHLQVAEEKELTQAVERLEVGDPTWLLLPTEGSFENRVVQEMAEEKRWQKLSLRQIPTLDACQELAKQKHLTILHYDPRRFYVEGTQFRQWLEQELAPRLGLEPPEWAPFANDFLQTYHQSWAIGTVLLVQVIREE